MAATLAPSTYSLPLATLRAALAALTPGSVAYNLLADQLDVEVEHRAEVAAENGYIRMREFQGYDEARLQEQMEALHGIPA